MSVRMTHGEGDSLLFDFGGPCALLVREVTTPHGPLP
jgi:hypothetical protein